MTKDTQISGGQGGINVLLPAWINERHQYVFAGIELVAYKHANGKWMIKTGRCNMCGKCCDNMKGTRELPVDENGTCVYLETQGEERVCSLKVSRPINCSFGRGRDRVCAAECSEVFEEIA